MRTINRLTDIQCENAAPRAARYEIADGGGLFLVVQTTGAKSWAFRYRHQRANRKLTFGAYPALSLKAARRLARATLERTAGGSDPATEKQTARHQTPSQDTEFAVLAALFLDRWLTKGQQRPRPRTIAENARLLGLARQGSGWAPRKGGLAERWRGRQVSSLTRAEIVDVLDELVADRMLTKANHTRAVLHLFFGWCQRRGVLAANPVSIIDRPAPRPQRERVLTDAELALLWRAADEDGVFGPLYKFLALTGQRRDEARGATWPEIDLDAATWTIPGSRTKNGKTHLVPLSPPAVTLLRTIMPALPRAGRRGMIFTTTGATMLSGLSRAKERLDKRMLELRRAAQPDAIIPPFVLHDLRRTCATGLQRLGIRLEVIEKILNHSGGSFAGVVGIYQRHDFANEKRAALDAWARHVEAINVSIGTAAIAAE
jgi:integrase